MVRNFTVKKVRKRTYPATYNFRDEVDGTSGTDIDFIDTDNSGADCIASIISSIGNHKKILELFDNNGAGRIDIYNTFSAQEFGTIEFFIRSSDVTQVADVFISTGGADTGIHFSLREDKFRYYDGIWNDIVAASDDVIYHIRIDFECGAGAYLGLAADTFYATINGTQYGPFDFRTVIASATYLRFVSDTGATNYYFYIDAIGYSWDTDYKIGDNVFWRHYFDQDSDFESEDVGSTSTSIDFVDTDDTGGACEVSIIAEFNEHKKILQLYDADGDQCDIYNDFVPQTIGTVEFWYKTTDVTKESNFVMNGGGVQALTVGIGGGVFRYHDGAFHTIVDAENDTWYHLKIVFDCGTDTYYVWIDNIQYGAFNFRNVRVTLDAVRLNTGNAPTLFYAYFDAFSYSWNNEVADNRIFDYNDLYTREDITDKVENVITSNILHGWRTGTLYSKEVYYNDEVFFQIYDVNSKLGMEADIINREQFGALYHYPLLDKNADDLVNESSNTFSVDKIHDPTDSTSILKVILPNVSEVDGDLILVDADTKTDTYSPITKNYPDYMMLRDISDLSDSVVIIDANGKCYLDDDKASGDSLDKDVAADKLIMTKPPIPNDIVGVNYFVIKGAMNPDTGERFFKVVDNSGNDKINTFRITNNQLKNQTDVDNYAAKLAAKLISVKEIVIETQGLGFHNMGETFNYKYIDAVYNIPQADYYIIKEDMDYDLAASIIVLSDGLVELSKYAQRYERPENYNDSYAAEIYETDINTVYPGIMPGAGAAFGLGAGGDYGVVLNTNLDFVVSYFFIDTKVDESRGVEIKIFWTRDDANNDTLFGSWSVNRRPIDGSAAWASAGGSVEDFDACVSGRGEHHPISLSTVEADYEYRVFLNLNEVARSMTITSVVVRYYIKREL